MQNTYEKLEFERILVTLASFAHTEQGKKAVLESKMFKDTKGLENELSFLREAILIYRSYEKFPIQTSSDLRIKIDLAIRGASLGEEDFAKIVNDIEISEQLSHYFISINIAPKIKEYFENNKGNLSFLKTNINRVISPDLSILDGASSELRRIRGAKKRLEESLRKKLSLILEQYKEYLSENTLTLRNGHYVLPVQNAYKRKVLGIIQDISGSGETTFIEPAILVEINNKMTELNIKEREEIRRILKALTGEVVKKKDEVLSLNSMIGRLDVLGAKAQYASSLKAVVADISSRPLLKLEKARHPLLKKETIVANDFYLDEKNRILIISGPNAGGKTVALKTLGIIVLMHQFGLAVPAEEGAKISFFKGIYVDIGDSQSISDNLSTFSGHMQNIGEILRQIGGSDLVLLDELGTGTSPKEGEAIAYATISALLKKHAFTLISSHYEGIKALALSKEGLINASMLFNEETLEPTYHLKSGLPGESYGLIAAKRFGLPAEVINDAKNYLTTRQDFSIGEAIKKLNEATRRNEEEVAKNVKEKFLLEKERKRLNSKEAVLQMKEETLNKELLTRQEMLLHKYQEKLDEIMESLKHDNLKFHEVIAARKKLEAFKGKEEVERFSEELIEGDEVNVPSMSISGRIKKVQSNKIEIVTAKGMTFKVDISLAYKVHKSHAQKVELRPSLNPDAAAYKKGVPLELNLIGEHLLEAKEDLEKYLDDCRILGYKRVRIIHGFGGGVLRKMVNDYVKAHPEFIDHSELAKEGEGSGGATIVYLK